MPYSVFGNGRATVVSAGTRVPLSSSTAIASVTVRALASNTGLIYVGNSAVSSANGFQLSASETVSMDIDNLSKVFIDSAVSGGGVSYAYVSS